MDEPSAAPKTDKIRLNKYIANSGISSRREADELITMGLISVNGKIISELGYKVNPGDEVRYESKVLHPEKPVYILLLEIQAPRGDVQGWSQTFSHAKDPSRHSVPRRLAPQTRSLRSPHPAATGLVNVRFDSEHRADDCSTRCENA